MSTRTASGWLDTFFVWSDGSLRRLVLRMARSLGTRDCPRLGQSWTQAKGTTVEDRAMSQLWNRLDFFTLRYFILQKQLVSITDEFYRWVCTKWEPWVVPLFWLSSSFSPFHSFVTPLSYYAPLLRVVKNAVISVKYCLGDKSDDFSCLLTTKSSRLSSGL